MNFLSDLRRRKVFRLAGLYIVGAWVVIEVASISFPAWGIPDTALRYLFIAAALLFPVALVFAWLFDITPEGVVRTPPASTDDDVPLKLGRSDYLILVALAVITAVVLTGSLEQVAQESTDTVTSITQKPENSVAVLPFSFADDAADAKAYADGISEAVLHRLASYGSVKVLASNSSFRFRETDKSIPQLSNILGVRYLLSGSIERDGDQIMIRASLTDDAGFEVWNKGFDGPITQIFDFQNGIAAGVANHITAGTTATEYRTGATTTNAEAYRHYLVGMEYSNSRSPGWQESAEQAFRQAIAEDPGFAPAHAGLAKAIYIGAPGIERIERRGKALEIATRAYEIQPDLAETRAVLGLVLSEGDESALEEARTHLETALRIDPSYSDAYNWLAAVLRQLGHEEEWQRMQERGIEIDPLNPALVSNVASRIEAKGDFDGAIKLRKRLLQLPNPSGLAYWGLYIQYHDYQNLAEALYWAKEAAIAYDGTRNQLAFFSIANVYEQLGLAEESEYWLNLLDQQHPDPMATLIRRGYMSVMRGDMAALGAICDKLAATGITRSERIPPNIKQRLGAFFALAGQPEVGVPLLESALRIDQPVEPTTISAELGQMTYVLAIAYRELGDEDKAVELLQRGHTIVSMLRADGLHQDSPSELEMLVYQHILSDDLESAAIALRKAIDAGWTNYYWFYNAPYIEEAARSPELAPLFAEALLRVEEQRDLVLEQDATDNFRERIQLMLERNSET